MKKKRHCFFIITIAFLIVPNLIYEQLTRKAPYLIYTGDEQEIQIDVKRSK